MDAPAPACSCSTWITLAFLNPLIVIFINISVWLAVLLCTRSKHTKKKDQQTLPTSDSPSATNQIVASYSNGSITASSQTSGGGGITTTGTEEAHSSTADQSQDAYEHSSVEETTVHYVSDYATTDRVNYDSEDLSALSDESTPPFPGVDWRRASIINQARSV